MLEVIHNPSSFILPKTCTCSYAHNQQFDQNQTHFLICKMASVMIWLNPNYSPCPYKQHKEIPAQNFPPVRWSSAKDTLDQQLNTAWFTISTSEIQKPTTLHDTEIKTNKTLVIRSTPFTTKGLRRNSSYLHNISMLTTNPNSSHLLDRTQRLQVEASPVHQLQISVSQTLNFKQLQENPASVQLFDKHHKFNSKLAAYQAVNHSNEPTKQGTLMQGQFVTLACLFISISMTYIATLFAQDNLSNPPR
ncbi:hypothetical protein Droror1_Dr00004369 [Drosera rotundifolia]